MNICYHVKIINITRIPYSDNEPEENKDSIVTYGSYFNRIMEFYIEHEF